MKLMQYIKQAIGEALNDWFLMFFLLIVIAIVAGFLSAS